MCFLLTLPPNLASLRLKLRFLKELLFGSNVALFTLSVASVCVDDVEALAAMAPVGDRLAV